MRESVLVFDIDNTLYDWVLFYVPCFLKMIAEIARISGADPEEIKASFQRVHRRHGTSEYSFAIGELDILDRTDQELSPAERVRKYDSAIHAFRSCRRALLQPYPGVAETLRELRDRGVRLVAHSDSMIVTVSRRLRQLDLDTYFEAICGGKDSGVPDYLPVTAARVASDSDVGARTRLIELPTGVRKPDPMCLAPVLREFEVQGADLIYVGDSVSKDMRLAAAIGARGLLAEYGRRVDPALYAELLKITAWTPDAVLAEESERPDSSFATIHSFREILMAAGLVIR